MDVQQLRRVAPVVYGALVVVVALFADGALLPVVVVGAVLLGLLYATTGDRTGGRQRARDRR